MPCGRGLLGRKGGNWSTGGSRSGLREGPTASSETCLFSESDLDVMPASLKSRTEVSSGLRRCGNSVLFCSVLEFGPVPTSPCSVLFLNSDRYRYRCRYRHRYRYRSRHPPRPCCKALRFGSSPHAGKPQPSVKASRTGVFPTKTPGLCGILCDTSPESLDHPP